MKKINSVISDGTACGKVLKFENGYIDNSKDDIDVDKEISILKNALKASNDELDDILMKSDNDSKQIIDAHKMIINDPVLNKQIIDKIKTEKISAKKAFTNVLDDYIKAIGDARSDYLVERSLDIKDVKRRILLNMDNRGKDNLDGKYILVCEEVFPTFLIAHEKNIIGVVSLHGGYTSHSAILCRNNEIPYVVVDDIKDINDLIIIDTRKKIIINNPSADEIKSYENYNKNDDFKLIDFSKYGVKVYANASSTADVKKVLRYNLSGIGLFRTEFIFMNMDRAMKLDEQEEIYNNISSLLNNKEVTYRTFDIGDDKQLSYIKTFHKGIDNYKNNPELFENQIKAIILSNTNNNVRIMFPMIERYDEFKFLHDWVLKIKDNLHDKSKIKIGMMLETKEAFMHLDEFKDVPFMSIGTNDLTHELYNISRENITDYHSYINDLLNVLKRIVEFTNENNIDLSICGEIASVKKAAILLYKNGIRKFSISPSSIRVLSDAIKECGE